MRPLSTQDLDAVRSAMSGSMPTVDAELAGYRNDPVGFVEHVLGLRLWSHQRRALEAARDHRRVSWRSAHGVGKSVAVMAMAVWWLVTRPGAAVLITAPTHRQVDRVDYRTLLSIVRNARRPLGGELHEVPAAGWKFDDGRFLVGFSAQNAESFAGFHSPALMAIADEASGIDAGIFEALKGALTGDSRLFLVGNPTQLSGEFYSSHGPRKSGLYYQLHTSAYESPNVTGECEPIPGLVDQLMIDEQAADYGEDSAAFAVRVLGEFPSQSVDSVISLALVEAARDRWDAKAAAACTALLEVGLDPARFGDDSSCIALRRGPYLLQILEATKLDAMALGNLVVRTVHQHRRTGERPIVRVDSTGLGGPIVDQLKRQLLDCDVVGIGAGESPENPAYQRRRDELWHTLRDWLRDGGTFAPDPRLEAELVAPRYSFSPTQKIVVESKDELRKRLRRSPDRADALALAVYKPSRPRVRWVDTSDIRSPRRTEFIDEDQWLLGNGDLSRCPWG